jgi:hypothetical protein
LRKRVLARIHPRVIVGLKDLQYLLFARPEVKRAWQRRIELVVTCPDGADIPRVERAGAIVGSQQVMHNGIRVLAGGYYGAPVREMLRRSRGIHEPQEERVFAKILEEIRPGATMIELGAYWGYYSLWFAHAVSNARCVLVESHPLNINVGRYNLTRSGVDAAFVEAYAGQTVGRAKDGTPTTTVDRLLEEFRISQLAILHSDIQGAEADMLRGAMNAFRGRRIDYVFISTHSNAVHQECEAILRGVDYHVITSIDLDGTFSEDGLIVAKRPGASGPDTFPLSRRGS